MSEQQPTSCICPPDECLDAGSAGCYFGKAQPSVPGPVGTESGLRIVTEPGFGTMVEFAVATLDDGTEVRMRCLGNRVEVRTWDETASCNPPPLVVDRVGGHVVDARPGLAAALLAGPLDGCRDLAGLIGKVLLDEGAGPDSGIHSWRCSHPDRYGPCECVAEVAREVAAQIRTGWVLTPRGGVQGAGGGL